MRANLSLEKVYKDSLGEMVVRRESKAGRPFDIGTFVQEMEAKVATTRRKHPPRPWFKLMTSGTSGMSPPVMCRSPCPEGIDFYKYCRNLYEASKSICIENSNKISSTILKRVAKNSYEISIWILKIFA